MFIIVVNGNVWKLHFIYVILTTGIKTCDLQKIAVFAHVTLVGEVLF